MMKARFLRSNILDELWKKVPNHLLLYRQGNFDYLTTSPSYFFEAEIDIDEVQLVALKPPSGDKRYDSENALIAGNALANLGPYQAGDERLWTYLTHTNVLEYARHRWPIPADDEEAVKHIRTHFFGKSARGRERDNALSRLWWMHHLALKAPKIPIEKALEVLLFKADVRASLLERPTTAQNDAVVSAVLSLLLESYRGKQALFARATFRALMMALNGLGGYNLLDVQNTNMMKTTLKHIISHDLKLAQL